MTLEEAQAQIVDLQEQITQLTTERDSLSQNNERLTADVERLRTLNQRYFEKLEAYHLPQPNNKGKENTDDKEPLSCEDFAKTLTI